MPPALGEGAPCCRAPSAASLAEDWRQYKRAGSVASRNRLVKYYMATHVRPIAIRVRSGLPQRVELDDLIQQGYLGLIDAMDRFDLTRATRFETFSRPRIFGAVHDYLRSIDTVPRLTRTRSKRVEEVIEGFEKQHGRPPTDGELGQRLDLPEAALHRALADRQPASMVLFSHVGAEGEREEEADGDAMAAFEDVRQAGPMTTAAARDLRRWLTHGLERRDQLIIILYYYEALTMREIAGAIGISESRVSQRLEAILASLRARLLHTGAELEFLPG